MVRGREPGLTTKQIAKDCREFEAKGFAIAGLCPIGSAHDAQPASGIFGGNPSGVVLRRCGIARYDTAVDL